MWERHKRPVRKQVINMHGKQEPGIIENMEQVWGGTTMPTYCVVITKHSMCVCVCVVVVVIVAVAVAVAVVMIDRKSVV